MQIITFCNQKGGCGKTVSVMSLAARLHEKCFRVLMIDLDPQRNLSFNAGADLSNEKTLYKVFKHELDIAEAVTSIKPGWDIITGGLEFAQADLEFSQQGREFLLEEALEELMEKKGDPDYYNFCLIDTSPNLGVLLMNSLKVSDYAIIPVNPDPFSMQGMSQLDSFIKSMKKHYNKKLETMGVLITRVDNRANVTKEVIKAIEKQAEAMETKTFEAKIRQTVAIPESIVLRDSVFGISRESAAADYDKFTDEFLNEINRRA